MRFRERLYLTHVESAFNEPSNLFQSLLSVAFLLDLRNFSLTGRGLNRSQRVSLGGQFTVSFK